MSDQIGKVLVNLEFNDALVACLEAISERISSLEKLVKTLDDRITFLVETSLELGVEPPPESG
ncbi:MAG: hypothetical protein O7D91_21535 [Planctomycetota bacterium]|nr:hypothetical protein [Planctomycetota bacterium]